MRKRLFVVLALVGLVGCTSSDESSGAASDAQAATSEVGPADSFETAAPEEEIIEAAPDVETCGDAPPECEPSCGEHVPLEEAACVDGQWKCPPIEECPPNPDGCPSEGEMSAMAGASCEGMEGIDCAYHDGAFDECPGGEFHCLCGDDGLWTCDCSM